MSKPVAKRSPAAKPAKVSSKPAKVSSKTVAKGAAKASKAPVAKAAPKAQVKPVAAKAAPAAKAPAKPEAKPAKIAAKAEVKPAAKPAAKPEVKPESKAEAKPEVKATKAKVASKVEPRADKPADKAAKAAAPAAEARSKGPAKAPTRKPAKSAPVDEDDEDDLDNGEDVPRVHHAHHPTAHESRGQIDLADVIRMEPEAPPAPRKKSVLEVAEEDEEFEDEPPLPTADDVHGLLDRLRKAAQYGGDALEDLPRLIEQLEQIDDPVVMPRLLGLLEDNDPYGIYWNVLYVLEKFDDAYLKVLLDGIEALYARAPQWAYTTIIRILNTRGDEDDCTAAFERLLNGSSPHTRTLVLQVLRELAADPETDHDQKQNIARTITAIGGDAPATPTPTPTPTTNSAD